MGRDNCGAKDSGSATTPRASGGDGCGSKDFGSNRGFSIKDIGSNWYANRHELTTTLEATSHHKEYGGHTTQTRDLTEVQ